MQDNHGAAQPPGKARWRDVLLPMAIVLTLLCAILVIVPFLADRQAPPGAPLLYWVQVVYLCAAALLLFAGLARRGQAPLAGRLGAAATPWDAGLLICGAVLSGLVPVGFLAFTGLALLSAPVAAILVQGPSAALGTVAPLALTVALGGTGLGFLLNYYLARLGLGLTLIKIIDFGVVIIAALLAALLFKNGALPLSLVPLYVPVLAILAAPTGMVASFPSLARR